jgi:sulfoxide reductase heme-binding subunit YedZ
MIARLGGKNWQRLHRLIYVSAIAGVVHYIWLVKKDEQVPTIFACVLATLFLYRMLAWIRQRRQGSLRNANRELWKQQPDTAGD